MCLHNPGLNMDNELLHGRFAMLGLVALVGISTIYQMPILDVINAGVGGAYGAAPLMGTAGAALATKVATIAAPPAAKVAAAAGAAGKSKWNYKTKKLHNLLMY